MTDQPKDGGPAFPATVQGWNDRLSQSQGGMSLRDWFAGQALAHMVSGDTHQLPTWRHVAAACYDAADAMLEARVKHADATP